MSLIEEDELINEMYRIMENKQAFYDSIKNYQ
jgi:hypothetical protein